MRIEIYYEQARMTENLGKCDYEEEIRKRTKTIFVPNWFSVDLKVGVSNLFQKIKSNKLFLLDFNNHT